MKTQAYIRLTGNFAGTFFKSTAKGRAKLLNIQGWIKNTSEGEIEAVLEGQKEQVEVLIRFLENAPNGAQIYDMQVDWKEPLGEFRSFEILHDDFTSA